MVKLTGVSKKFKDAGLYDINAFFPEKSVCTIIGRSGAGKSLLLRTILGLIRPDSGSVLIGGTDIYKVKYKQLKEVRSKFGVLFQNNALLDSMNVFENVSLPVVYRNPEMRYNDVRNLVKEKLKMAYLDDVTDKYINQLSGGMQKRVAIARALITDPEILFYDEPITGLDPLTADGIIDLIKNLYLTLKKTTIIITHDIRGFIDFTDYIMLIDSGETLFCGTKEDFMSFDHKIAKAYIKMAGRL
ncbi:TPA: ABC transporter ATP-binding protein [candidate division WOR-3 bacterium]|jgi:phospholipid/cholesterol/gamma-HCH transport system ATP-binding protein|uniref:ABC transporter ATP-binding protein n=1 Tax=candidate division WOR-3 bacterium TaxID=2052148 RepID=A0A350H9Q8_UNCW3|nr:ABC transporter ATP-binding protein [candidate division WOR-3 bacterium]